MIQPELLLGLIKEAETGIPPVVPTGMSEGRAKKLLGSLLSDLKETGNQNPGKRPSLLDEPSQGYGRDPHPDNGYDYSDNRVVATGSERDRFVVQAEGSIVTAMPESPMCTFFETPGGGLGFIWGGGMFVSSCCSPQVMS